MALSVVLCCGAECQIATPAPLVAGSHHWSSVSGAVTTVDTTVFDAGGGSAAFKVAAAGGIGNKGFNRTIAQNQAAWRVKIRITANPSANATITRFSNANGNLMVWLTTTGQLQIQIGGSGTLVNVGSALSVNTWYRLDVSADTSGATATMAAQLDGGVEATTTASQAAANMTNLAMGVFSSGVTLTIYFDQIILTSATADYPIGAGYVQGYLPKTVSGTHSTAADFKDHNLTLLANGDNTGSELQEVPADTTSWVEQTIALSTAYAEHVYNTSAETKTPRAVEQIVNIVASDTTGGDQKVQLYDGTTATDSYALTTIATTTVKQAAKQWASPPSGGSWTAGLFNGNLRSRWGFSTTGGAVSTPRLTNTLLEAEFSSVAAVAADTPFPFMGGGYFDA